MSDKDEDTELPESLYLTEAEVQHIREQGETLEPGRSTVTT